MAAKREVSVRMYRTGLGDCFVLSFPRKGKGRFRMMIDCGALTSADETLQGVVAAVAEDGPLDVVAGTHEHWDHISGFRQAKAEFAGIGVGAVWVAWTEDPESEDAARVRREFKKAARALAAAVGRMPPGAGPLAAYRRAIEHVLEFGDGLGAAKVNRTSEAWANLLALGRPVYCALDDRPLTFDGVPGVRVYVLGPPTDSAMLRKTLSKKETYDAGIASVGRFDSFCAAADGGSDPESAARAQPFDPRLQIPESTARDIPFFRDRYGFGDAGPARWRRIGDDWLGAAGELALHLDSYTNNTCLALAIELVDSGRVLLFPGDAQVGNWLSWADRSWKVPDGAGGTRTVTAADLFARTVLYKVGHHGSHNATLRTRGLELMNSPDLVAMIPVDRKTAKQQEWKFPYPALWDRLKVKAKGRVLLADSPDLTEIEAEARARLTSAEWTAFRKRTAFTDLYVEHRVPM